MLNTELEQNVGAPTRVSMSTVVHAKQARRGGGHPRYGLGPRSIATETVAPTSQSLRRSGRLGRDSGLSLSRLAVDAAAGRLMNLGTCSGIHMCGIAGFLQTLTGRLGDQAVQRVNHYD